MLIKELLERLDHSSKIALKQSNKVLSYNEWNNYSKSMSIFIRRVLKESSTVALFLPNSINYAISYFAVMYANKVLTPIDIKARECEILSTLKYCEIDLIMTDLQHIEFIKRCCNKYDYKINIYIVDTNEIILVNSEKNFINKSDYLLFKNTEDDVAIMLHTSGTTSDPKRVMLTHKNLICNVESNISSLKFTSNDKVLIALPMFFGYCNTAQFLTHVYLGASIVILDSLFLPKQFFKIVEKEKITNFTSVPSMLLMLLNYNYSEKYDYSSLRYICFGGGKMPVEQLKQLIKKYPSIGFIQTYGQTECSPRVTALLPSYSLKKIGSVGTPITNVNVNIIDTQGNCLSSNKIGEIVVNGNNIMKGYYKKPELTKRTINNGWLHTGDLGYFDNEGFLYLTGRIKNIIISNGINIYPEEIEELLLQHESVEDVIVLGKKHKIKGEIPIAKIVLKSKITEFELKEYCSKRIADYKIPVEFEFVDYLPKTYNGKNKRF